MDEGAKQVLLKERKSLLPAGVKRCEGSFDIGDAVEVGVEGGKIFARGLVAYSHMELEKIKGAKTSAIQNILGYKYTDEVIHRDDLVILVLSS